MAKRGKCFVIHGAFATKAAAVRKERAGKGRWIVERRVRGHKRYVVLSEK